MQRMGTAIVVAMVVTLTASGCGASTRSANACQLLTRAQAENVLGIGTLPLQATNVGSACEYRSGQNVLIIQIHEAGVSKTNPPFKAQPGSSEVTVRGVDASWRRATSPTRFNILAFRRQTAVVEIVLSPSVVGAEVKAKKAMGEVMTHLRELH